MKRLVWLAAIVAATLAASSARADIIVDDFDNGPLVPLSLNAPGGFGNIQNGLAGVLGGQRRTTLFATAADAFNAVSRSINTAPPGVLNYNSDNAADGAIRLRYDGGGALLANLTAGGNFAIIVNFTLFDLSGGNPLPVTLTASDGVDTQSVTLVNGSISPPVNNMYFFFNNPGFNLINWANITSLQFDFEAAVAADFQLNFISATGVPAPTGLFLGCAGGLLGIGAAWRARRAKKVVA